MSIKIRLQNVRVSYPHLFEARAYKGSDNAKFSITCLLDPKKNADAIEEIEDAIEDLIDAEFKGKRPKNMRIILKDGNDKVDEDTDEVADGYEDMLYLKASSKKRPIVVDKDLTDLDQSDDKPYGGCFCTVSLRLYAQNNDFGKHINVTLLAVMFEKDGDRFGAEAVDAEKEFGDIAEGQTKRKKRRRSRDEDEDDDEPAPRRKKRRRSREDDDDDDILD